MSARKPSGSMKNTPRLRFRRNGGTPFPDWEEKKLGEILDYEQPSKYIVKSTQYDDKYPTPVLTPGKTFVLGRTDEQDGIFSKGLPVIIFDDFTTAIQFVDFDFKVKSSAIKILRKKDLSYSIRLIYELMKRVEFIVSKQKKRHWISESQYEIITLPHPDEQKKIADFLAAVDRRIDSLKDKRAGLQTYKRGMMQQFFSRNIRFRRKNGQPFPDWEEKKLGEVVKKITETSIYAEKNKPLPLIELENIESGTGKILHISNAHNKKSLKWSFKSGDVLFGKLRPYLKKFANPNFDGICSSEIWIFRGISVLNCFLFYIVQTEEFLKTADQSSGSKMPRADWSIVGQKHFDIPHPDEQKKIADFLTAIDHRIDLIDKQISQTQAYKKGLMQQMFA
ncbi:MAG: restriction endonuclease subunit S [Pseudomonadota bacterium]